MEIWKRLDAKTIHETGIFTLDEVRLARPGRAEPVRFARLRCPDWVNVIPLTEDRGVILIRQYRAGRHAVTLEIPGGQVDSGEDPETCAARELTEETGWVAASLEELGAVEPNPAFQDNRCFTYLASGCRPVGETDFDADEEIETVIAELDEIPRLIAAGEIRHALVIAAFYHLFVSHDLRI